MPAVNTLNFFLQKKMENLEILILPVSQATTSSSVPKMDTRKPRSNELELVNTDESGEFFTHSSFGSFRYQLSNSNLSKNRQRSKLHFKLRSKNFAVLKLFLFLNKYYILLFFC